MDIESLKYDSFFGVLWPGETEMDVPYLYYFNGDGYELQDSPNQSEAILKMCKFLIGLHDMSQSLFGNTKGPLKAQIFNSQIVVARIGRYGIVFQYNKTGTLLQNSLLNIFHLLCQVFFQDQKNVEQETKKQESNKSSLPPFPSLNSEQIKSQIGILFNKLLTDPLGILVTDSILPPLFPRDVISPYIYALQQLRAVQVQFPSAVMLFTVNGRPLLSTIGPFLTNQILLLATCHDHLVNHKLTYLFGEYEITKKQNAQRQVIEDTYSQFSSVDDLREESHEMTEQSNHHSEQQINNCSIKQSQQSLLENTQTLYINQLTNKQESQSSQVLQSSNESNDQECCIKLFIITTSPVQIKQSFLGCQLKQLSQKFSILGAPPPLYDNDIGRQQQLQSPFPGNVDTIYRDGAKMLRCLAGVENIQICKEKSTFAGLQDATLVGFFMRRQQKWIRCIHACQIFDKDRFTLESYQQEEDQGNNEYVYEESKRSSEQRQKPQKPVSVGIVLHEYKNYDYQDILASSMISQHNTQYKSIKDGFQKLDNAITEQITVQQVQD